MTTGTEPKPDCYQCQWRRGIAGDAHSSCAHPDLGLDDTNPMFQMFSILSSAKRINSQVGIDKLGIKANYQGIRKGWVNFPFNFDPMWIEACNGFALKGREK